MFKNFKDDEVCPTCNKNLNDLAEGKIKCAPCLKDGDRLSAQRGVLHHLWLSIWCLLNFEFLGFIAELYWTIERLTGTGDYDKEDGEYYVKGYLKR